LGVRCQGWSGSGRDGRGREALVEGIRRLVEQKTLVEGKTFVEGKTVVEGRALLHGHRWGGLPVRLLHLMPPRWENKRHAKSGNERRDPSADQAHPDVTQEIPRCPSRGPLRPAVSQHIAFPDVQRRKQNIAARIVRGQSPKRLNWLSGAIEGRTSSVMLAIVHTSFWCVPRARLTLPHILCDPFVRDLIKVPPGSARPSMPT